MHWAIPQPSKFSCLATLDRRYPAKWLLLSIIHLDPSMHWCKDTWLWEDAFPHQQKDHKSEKNFVLMKFACFEALSKKLQSPKWTFALPSTPTTNNKQTEKHFNTYMKDYLDAITKCINLSDQVIQGLYLKSKTSHMKFEDFLYHCTQILGKSKMNGYTMTGNSQQRWALQTGFSGSTSSPQRNICWEHNVMETGDQNI